MALIPTTAAPEDYRRRLAYKLMMEGTDASPVQHWAQGLARMGQGALGGYEMHQADERDKATEAGNNSALIAALGGMPSGPSSPSAQPSPQRPTAQPSMPVSSVTPNAGAIPAALAGARPGGPVAPSAKVWGDKEAEEAGLYEKPAAGPQIAANGPVALPPQPSAPMVPTPVKTEAIAPPQAADPRMADAKARLAEMLRSDNPQMRKVGSNMAQQFIQSEMARQFKPTEWDFKQSHDGSYIAINKANPSIVQAVPGSGGGQAAIDYKANETRAVKAAEREGLVGHEAAKAGAVKTAEGLATRNLAKPEQDKQNQKVASIVIEDIDRGLKTIDNSILPTTGATGNVLSMVGGTAAHGLSKLLDTVKSNAGFQELSKMRAASPTGAALGSVTERELALLQSTIGNLEQSQPGDQLKDNMRRVKNTYLDIIHGEGKGPPRESLTFQEKKNAPVKIDGYTIKAR